MRYCSECKKEKEDSYCVYCKKETNSNFVMKVETGIYKVRQPLLKMVHKRPGIKRFLKKVFVGWQDSRVKDKHPEGVNISRIVDREYNLYEETVTDNKTGEVIRNIKEPLDQHISSSQKKNNQGKNV